MFLGLDISTSITGATVLDDNGKILYCEAWDMRNKNHFPSPFIKADFVKNSLLDLTIKFRIEHIFVEQSLQAFRPGFSSAKTLLTLARFNGIVSYICLDVLGIEPEYISASTARLQFNVPTGDYHYFTVNDVGRLKIDSGFMEIQDGIDIRNPTTTTPSSAGFGDIAGWVKIQVDGGNYSFPVWNLP